MEMLRTDRASLLLLGVFRRFIDQIGLAVPLGLLRKRAPRMGRCKEVSPNGRIAALLGEGDAVHCIQPIFRCVTTHDHFPRIHWDKDSRQLLFLLKHKFPLVTQEHYG